ncbi:MAG: HypC/HybG/HupF family hydrogenase formation chaperone [Pseudomonadota bacterium]
MCLAIPARIEKLLPDQRAIADVGGIQREISTALVDNIHINDYVIVHVGYALSRLDETEAKETLALFDQMLAEENH